MHLRFITRETIATRLERLIHQEKEKSPELQMLIETMQQFIDSRMKFDLIHDVHLIDFLNMTPGLLDKFIHCFVYHVDTRTTCFWAGPLKPVFSGRQKMIFMGVRQSELAKLDFYLTYDLPCAETAWQKIIANKDYLGPSSLLSAWEIACLSGKPELFREATKKLGMNPNTINEKGCSPVHLAIMSGATRQVYTAIQCGHNPDILLRNGKSGLSLAVENKDRRMAAFLFHLRQTSQTTTPSETRLPPEVLACRSPRMTMYLPLGIVQLNQFGGAKTPHEIQTWGNLSLLPIEAQYINFKLIAQRLASHLAQDCHKETGTTYTLWRPIAESIEELKHISEKNHVFDKYHRGVYALEVSVHFDDLITPRSMLDIHGPHFSDRSLGTSWGLRNNANIQLEHIKGITLIHEQCTSEPKTQRMDNPDFDTNPSTLDRSASDLAKTIRKFVNREFYWCQHVSFLKTSTGDYFPEPVKEMQKLCEDDDAILLNLFKRIAKFHLPKSHNPLTSYALSFFQPDEATVGFYRAIMNANSLYDVEQWIVHQTANSPTRDPSTLFQFGSVTMN